MRVVCLPVSSMQENAYFYFDGNSKRGVVIDPGGDGERLCRFISDNGLAIEAILLTHAHFDHILAVGDIKAATSAKVVCHAAEDAMLRDPARNMSKMVRRSAAIEADVLLNDGDVFEFGGHKLKAIHTPGHTPGGVCYYAEESASLFSGDTLFYDSVGRTDLDGGDDAALRSAIKDKLFTLPDETAVYPGHGEDTTIGHEKAHNPFVRA